MSAPLQRLPECTLAAIVATAVVFALNTAPSPQVVAAEGFLIGGLVDPAAGAARPGEDSVTGRDPDGRLASVDPSAPVRREAGSGPRTPARESAEPAGLRTIPGVLTDVPLDHGGGREVGHLHRGRRHGLWRRYGPGGELLTESWYDDDLLDGSYSELYPGGGTSVQGQYAQDLRQGPWQHYGPDGSLVIEEHYEGGLRHGLWTRLYSDGSVREMGAYERGKRVGPWIFRTPDGNLTRQSGTYEAGVKISD